MKQIDPSALAERLRRIRLVIFDVDGTLTDGSIILGEREELKRFDIKDGLGIKLLMRAGIEVAFVTGRRSGAVERRARELRVNRLYQDEARKGDRAAALLEELGLKKEEAAAMGDDLPDLAVFERVGVRLAVADAAAEVIAEADWVSSKPGGRGAAREAAELILKAQGRWERIARE